MPPDPPALGPDFTVVDARAMRVDHRSGSWTFTGEPFAGRVGTTYPRQWIVTSPRSPFAGRTSLMVEEPAGAEALWNSIGFDDDVKVARNRPAFDERVRIGGSNSAALKAILSSDEVQDALVAFFDSSLDAALVAIGENTSTFYLRREDTGLAELKTRLLSVARLVHVLERHGERPAQAADGARSGAPLAYRGRKA